MKKSDAGSSSSGLEESAVTHLSHLCEKLDPLIPFCNAKEWKKMLRKTDFIEDVVLRAKQIVLEEFGVSLSLERDGVDRDGLGVFAKSCIRKDQLVGLYPGILALAQIYKYQNCQLSRSIASGVREHAAR